MKVFGNPAFKSVMRPQRVLAAGPLYTLILVVKDASSAATIPFEWQGSCSGIMDGKGVEGGSLEL